MSEERLNELTAMYIHKEANPDADLVVNRIASMKKEGSILTNFFFTFWLTVLIGTSFSYFFIIFSLKAQNMFKFLVSLEIFFHFQVIYYAHL